MDMLGYSEFGVWIGGITYFALFMNLEEEHVALLHTASAIKR